MGDIMDKIIIKGARENNLKNIDIELPKNKLIVMTGISGSGKSSLAFDTLYKEGERRYVESLSNYARQFLGGTDKPDVDSIEGLSPSISIEQKVNSNNPRSTVGTVTEIYDYFRLLYARVGRAYCPYHDVEIKGQSVEEMVNKLLENKEGTKLIVMAPVIRGEKGTHKDLLEKLRKEGFVRIRANGEMYDLSDEIIFSKNIKDNIDVVIDRLIIKENISRRLFDSLEVATKLADGKVLVEILGEKEILFSEKYACPYCEFSLSELEPRIFSFNSPYNACSDCNGLGVKLSIDPYLIIKDDNLSIEEDIFGALYGDKETIFYKELEAVCKKYKISMSKPFNKLTKKEKDIIFYGSDEEIEYEYVSKNQTSYKSKKFEGIVTLFERRYLETKSEWMRNWIENFMVERECPRCKGARLDEKALSVRVGGKNIYELSSMSIKDIYDFFEKLKLGKEEIHIADLLIKEIKNRLSFLINVGLEYLTLSRNAGTLSGGESQRIRLATQIGSRLTGVLYVLDEPSIGLHQRDNAKLINSLKEMRDLGNTLVVVEHDSETMMEADYLVDIGPLAGEQGGYVVAKGTPKEVMENKDSVTGNFLSGRREIEVPKKRRKGNGKFLEVIGATENNLKNINVKFPLGTYTCVTGVSGSGKSSLVINILANKLFNHVYKSKVTIGKHKNIKGLEHIDKVVLIDQKPIGRTPRSNPATYVGVFDDIRDLFTTTKEAKMYGFKKDRFSFNVKGGRCEACRGDGVKKIEMHFLPDVYVPCEVCKGTRYNSDTLIIKYKNKNIFDVLNMRVSESIEFFENHPKIKHKLNVLDKVGLGYIKLGQSATTLSGGEASRVKLAKELQKKPTGKTVFIMDEPTTGLHFVDVERLLAIIKEIVDNEDTVIVIEHNLDMIKCADHIIDIGPEGGEQGGNIIAATTPEGLIKVKESYTGEFLKKVL